MIDWGDPGSKVFDGVVDNTFIDQTLIEYVTGQAFREIAAEP